MSLEDIFNHVSALTHELDGRTIAQLCGYVAALFTVTAYSMRTMIPLRISGICANCLFIAYGYFSPAYPNLVLHLVLLPLNLYRLRQMQQLVFKVKDAAAGDLSMDWIKPFTTARRVRQGEMIFAKGDVADALYYPMSGRYLVVEIGVVIKPGEIVGEMGLVAPESRRTQSFQCVEDGELLMLSYQEVRQLYFQNPRFGFYFLKLITQRLLANHRQVEQKLEALLAEKQIAPAGT